MISPIVVAIGWIGLAGCHSVFGADRPVDASAAEDGSVDAPDTVDPRLPECNIAPPLPPIPEVGAVATYYVDGDNGLDTAACLAEQPCKTIEVGLARAVANHGAGNLAGVVVAVAGGGNEDYATSSSTDAVVTLTAMHSGVVLRDWAERGGRPIVSAGLTKRYGIRLCCGVTATVTNFIVRDALEAGVVIEDAASVGNVLREIEAANNGRGAGTSDGGIVLTAGTRENLIANSVASDNRDPGTVGSKPAGIRAVGGTSSNQILGNTVYGNDGPGLLLRGTGDRVVGNRVTLNEDNGIEAEGDSALLCHNQTWANAASGVQISGTLVRVVHHTSHGNLGSGIHVLGPQAAIKNTIVSSNMDCGIRAVASVPTNHHDLYHANREARCGFVADPLAADVVGDPLFAAPLDGDFALLPGSPAIGAGEDGTTIGAL